LRIQTKEDSRRETAGRNNKPEDDWDAFYLQSKLSLLALHFPRLRIIWSSSPHESVKILSDLKLNFDEPEETAAILKGSSDAAAGAELLPGVENAGAVEMLRAIPGVSGHSLKYVMGKVESIREMAEMSLQQLQAVLGEEQGRKAWEFIQHDERVVREQAREQARRQLETWKQFHAARRGEAGG
jgi:DNA excision repair protein ERCC-4